MDLEPGTTIGRYRILEAIGRGGMGEVFRARDTRLQRDVAIKRLAPHVAQDESLRQRFDREAQALSQLQHANICSLYDVLEAEGQDFLVLELLEGEALNDILQRGPMEIDEAVRMAAQIASALGAAHDQGVIHRDIKPPNIMICGNGAKLLDFGVAKATASFADADADDAETFAQLTGDSSLVGTLRFMSPEQAAGRPIDARSDLFALGSVLYTALTGRLAVPDTAVGEVVARLMRFKPPRDFSRPDGEVVPDWLVDVVTCCLQHSPDRRFASAVELSGALGAHLTAWDTSGRVHPPPARRSGRLGWALAAGGVLLALAALWYVDRGARAPSRDTASVESAPTRRFSINLSHPVAPRTGYAWDLALAPDGHRLAYVAEVEGLRQLVVRPLDQLDGRLLEGTEGASLPFFSPDGEWLAFFKMPEGRLLKVQVEGGAPIDLAYAPVPIGGSWGDDDSIVFFAGIGRGLVRISSDGGEPEELTSLDLEAGEEGHTQPFLLPGSKALLFNVTRGAGPTGGRIDALRLNASGERITVVEDAVRATYLPSGHLVFAQQGRLMIAPFDSDSLTLAGEPREIVEPRLAVPENMPSQYAFSGDGTFAFLPGNTAARSVVWVALDGTEEPSGMPLAPYTHVRRVGDDEAVVFAHQNLRDMGIFSLATSVATPLGDRGLLNFLPVPSPDGSRLAFASDRGGQLNVWLAILASTEPPRQLTHGPGLHVPHSWSADGQSIFYATRPQEVIDEWLVDVESGESRSILSNPYDEGVATLSPNGRWLAYLSRRTGEFEIFIESFPEQDRRWQITKGGAEDPIWSPDGRTLYYRQGDRMMAGPIDPDGAEPLAGAARLLFEQPFKHDDSKNRPFDLSADGSRFLMIKNPEVSGEGDEVIVVQGWLEGGSWN